MRATLWAGSPPPCAHRPGRGGARAALDVRRDHGGAGAHRHAGPAGARRDRPPPDPPRGDHGCQAYLSIEVLDFGAGGKWITGRLDTQVPHRERIGPDGIVPAVERLLTVLLHNDPLVLRGPESTSWLARQQRALMVRSTMHAGLEVYELVTPVGAPLGTLPGVALSLRREVDQISIGVRVAGAFNPAAQPDGLSLRLQFDAQVEAAFYFRPDPVGLAVRERAGRPRLPALSGARDVRRSGRERRRDGRRSGAWCAGRCRGAAHHRRAAGRLRGPRGPGLRQPRSGPRRRRPVGAQRLPGRRRALLRPIQRAGRRGRPGSPDLIGQRDLIRSSARDANARSRGVFADETHCSRSGTARVPS